MASTTSTRRARRVAVPPCRDPFINNLLYPVPTRPGKPERFWITTWNSIAGCTGALVAEDGSYRLYPFADPLRAGFYSVAAEDPDTLWLWGWLSEVTRLDLKTGRYESFPTGAPSALVFHGMAHDPATGKLFAIAHAHGAGITAVSFDTRARQTARLYEEAALDWCLHGAYHNDDGTHTVIAECPGTSLLHWDPQAETMRPRRLREGFDALEDLASASYYRLLQDDDGRLYFPGHGWYDPVRRRFLKTGPRPNQEMTWFARHGGEVLGARYAGASATVSAWELASGNVREVAEFTDSTIQGVNLTQSGKLVGVSTYGEFTRRNLETGRLELSRLLPTNAIQHTDCLRMIDDERLLGTPFITQRFWEVNLKTGRGYDCGRAAPGGGEILQTWNLGGRIYMAEYGGGRLVEYDPSVHPHFPENPRTVANPPHSMRPIAAADDGRNLFYSCSAPYGHLGGAVTRYDTVTGASLTAVDPIPNHRLISLAYDRQAQRLLGGTVFTADCDSCPPVSVACYLAVLSPDDLTVQQQIEAPSGTTAVHALGALGRGRWLFQCSGAITVGDEVLSRLLLEVGGEPLEMPALDTARRVPEDWGTILPATKPGQFVVQVGSQVELWDLSRHKRLEVLYTRAAGRRLFVDGTTVLLLGNTDILVVKDAL